MKERMNIEYMKEWTTWEPDEWDLVQICLGGPPPWQGPEMDHNLLEGEEIHGLLPGPELHRSWIKIMKM